MHRLLLAATIGIVTALAVSIPAKAAEPLPRGDCAAPQPLTRLAHCAFAGQQLSGSDLSGAD